MIEKALKMKEAQKVYPEGTKLVFKYHTGYPTMDGTDFVVLVQEYTEDVLNQVVYDLAKDHAESYGIYPKDEYSEEEVEDDEDSYSDNIEGYFEIYNENKHDGLRVGDDNRFMEI